MRKILRHQLKLASANHPGSLPKHSLSLAPTCPPAFASGAHQQVDALATQRWGTPCFAWPPGHEVHVCKGWMKIHQAVVQRSLPTQSPQPPSPESRHQTSGSAGCPLFWVGVPFRIKQPTKACAFSHVFSSPSQRRVSCQERRT